MTARKDGRHVAVYVRVSTGEQNTENQLRQLEPVMRRAGVKSWVVYEDAGVSGAKDHAARPGMRKLLAEVARGEVSALWAWSQDRLGRSLTAHIALLDTLARAGVTLHTMGGVVDWLSATGRLMVSIVAAFAEFERQLIVERTKAGLATARAKGVHIGRPQTSVARRERVAELLHERDAMGGWTLPAVAEEAGVSLATVKRLAAAQKG